MELYTSEEAIFLIKYYEPLAIGQTLEVSTKSIIEKLEKEDCDDNKYRVNAVGFLLPGFVKPRRSIDLVARDLNLPSPSDVLKQLLHK